MQYFRIFSLNLRKKCQIILSVKIKIAIWRPEKIEENGFN